MPSDFPKTIKSPATWRGSDFKDGSVGQDQYTLSLNDAQIREVEQACDYFSGILHHYPSCSWLVPDFRLALHLPLEDVSQRTFPLPNLHVELKIFAQYLISGIGFFKVKGLDPNRYSRTENVVIYLGLSSYVGEQRGRQDELGNMLRALLMLFAAVVAPRIYPSEIFELI